MAGRAPSVSRQTLMIDSPDQLAIRRCAICYADVPVSRPIRGGGDMLRLDYFTGATERWRSEAVLRARRVRVDFPEDPLGYAEKRISLARPGSFERRRWRYIRKLLVNETDG